MTIDWNFIGLLEGHRLVGYVPDPEGSDSGVTVGTGVDLGQLSQAELSALSPALQVVLKPYVGLRGAAAAAMLKARPLGLSGASVDELDRVVEGADIAPLRDRFQKDAGKSFNSLPDAVQTVIASVTFQYGKPWVRCPHFWGDATVQNYPAMVACLRNFGDHYPTRRTKEAVYLEQHLNVEPLIS